MSTQNRSLSRGLRILRAFNQEPRPSLTQIASLTDLDKTTCRRYLLTLQEDGYVEYDPAVKKYRLRPLVLELGYAALGSMSVPQLAAPYMQDLANLTGGAANLATLDGDEIVLIGRATAEAEKRKLVTMNLRVGMRLPAHCTSMGRMLIASIHENLSTYVAQMHMHKVARTTVMDRTKLLQSIEQARVNGFAVVENQLSESHGAIAVPLHVSQTEWYALAASVTTGDFSYERLEHDVLPELRDIRDKLQGLIASKRFTRK